jgi:hypothetical protein
MATAIYGYAQFSDGTFGSFANSSVSDETVTESTRFPESQSARHSRVRLALL